MTKSELILAVRDKTDLPQKEVERIVNAVFATISEELTRGGKVGINGFGTFKVRERAVRQGRNPRTGDPIQLPASNLPHFKASGSLKAAVNGV